MADAALSALLRRPFAEQVAAFRARLGTLLPTARWDDLWQAQHDRAFMVAGAAQADLLADLAAAVDRAIAGGESIDQFRSRFRDIVRERGWQGWTGQGSAEGEAWRTRVIYTTNLRTSYAAGRMAQLRAGGYSHFIYRHGGSQDPRPQHLAWDGLVLPVDHPFWATHAPPNGWGCSCYLVGARGPATARRLGGDPDKALPDGWDRIDPRTGAPAGIDRGWAYSPGASVVDDVIQAVASKVAALPAPLGADLVATWPPGVVSALSAQFSAFVDRVMAGKPRGELMVVGALQPSWIAALAQRSRAPVTAEIAVRDRDVLHTFRDAKANTLPLDWYRDLPQHLRQPMAVLLDSSHADPALLLLYDVAGTEGRKLVLRLDYRLNKPRGQVVNLIQTGRVLDARGLASLRGGIGTSYTVLEGSL